MFMRKWTRSAGLLFCAVASVYNGPAAFAVEEMQRSSADSPPTVKLISDTPADAAASDSTPSTQPAGAPKVAINDSGTISIHTNNDISVAEILREIGAQAQISIISSKDVRGSIPAMDLYNVTINEALDAILHSNGMAWEKKGNLIYVYTQKELDQREKAARKTVTKTFPLHYIPASDVLSLIKPALSPDALTSATKDASTGINTGDVGTGSSGSTNGSTETGGNTEAGLDMIVVTDYPENLQRVSDIIKQIDCRPQQILVEATIFQANLTDNNSMGIDFSLMGGVNFDSLLASGTPLTSALSGNVLNTTNATGTGTAGSTANSAASAVQQGYAGFTTGNFDTQVPPGGLQIGIVKNNLGVFISALEAVTEGTVLANPKVLALDKQQGEVIVGSEFGYLTTTTTATTSSQTVQFLDTGTILSFRPYVGDDGYIRMEIHPEDSNGGLNASNLPVKNTTEVSTNLLVKDGNTIVIGGLFRETSSSSRNQVPFLGSLPLAGALFRSKTDATNRQEIIILLTPHIIKDDAQYSKSSEEQVKELEQMRVGVRKGMMWFGRERLAESAYENAVAEMNKPHPCLDLALWHLNCAINLNPKFIEAIEMKEKITGKQVTDVDNSAIRSFVRQQIMAQTLPPATAAAPATRPSVANATTRPMQSPATKPSYAGDSGFLPKPVTAIPVEPDDDQPITGQ
jgi:type IV pilus assembly protein PilQ